MLPRLAEDTRPSVPGRACTGRSARWHLHGWHAEGSVVLQDTGFAPAPMGTGQPYRPAPAPQRAPGPRSQYNPIFNPIISKSDPSTAATNMQTQARALSLLQHCLPATAAQQIRGQAQDYLG